jgi:hypothetical protein
VRERVKKREKFFFSILLNSSIKQQIFTSFQNKVPYAKERIAIGNYKLNIFNDHDPQ